MRPRPAHYHGSTGLDPLRRLEKLLQFYRFADGVFVLEVGDQRVALDSTDFGGKPAEKALVARLHATKEDVPRRAVVVDATAPLAAFFYGLGWDEYTPFLKLPR